MKRKIVVLDPSPPNRERLGAILFAAGFLPLLCSNREEALKRLQSGASLFLWSTYPEEQNGDIMETLHEIRKNPETTETFVILMTDEKEREEIDDAVQACIKRAESDEDLVEQVKSALEQVDRDLTEILEHAEDDIKEETVEEGEAGEIQDVFVDEELFKAVELEKEQEEEKEDDVPLDAEPGPGEEEKALALLKHMVERNLLVLEPALDSQSSSGYVYRNLEGFCPPGEEEVYLEWLVDEGCLTRRLKDKVTLCPVCSSYNLNRREVCTHCGSLEVKSDTWIRHFSCNFSGSAPLFFSGNDARCPRCRKELSKEGVDFIVFQKGYRCALCGKESPQPRKEALCFRCGTVSLEEDLATKALYLYQMTDLALDSAKKDILPGGDQARVLVDAGLGVYSYPFFQEILNLEFQRARRSRNPFTLLLATVPDFEEHFSRLGPEGGERVLRTVATFLRSLLRVSDVLAKYEISSFLVLLPETPLEDGRTAVQRIYDASRRIKMEEFPPLSFGLAAYPADGRSLKDLLEVLGEGRRRALDRRDGIFYMGGKEGRPGFIGRDVAFAVEDTFQKNVNPPKPSSESSWRLFAIILSILLLVAICASIYLNWEQLKEIISKSIQ